MKKIAAAALVLAAVLHLVMSGWQDAHAGQALDRVKSRGVLLWGADAEGGAPYVFPDPQEPSRLIGFEVDMAEAIASELGVKARQVQNAWDSLIPALERGDFDLVLNGMEITPQRLGRVLFTSPYYYFAEQLVIRQGDERIKAPDDLKGRTVGTLSGSVAFEILQKIGVADIKVYSGQAEPYSDLAVGRLDAVLMDYPIAAYYARPNPKLKFQGPLLGEGTYGIAFRKGDADLRDRVDQVLAKMAKEGRLRAIYEKWGIWTESQAKLGASSASPTLEESMKAPLINFLPALFKGAGITIFLSCLSMGLAVTLGLFLTVMRIYGSRPLAALATAYIEIYRGTPLLIQLYILYYGLPGVGIALSPIAAALIGLGMNYAAYEAEIYRAGIEAVPHGQAEAAVSLGMSRPLAFRLVIFPQAFRTALPGVTNDFIALFKDSSLVSVIAMVELTKTYNMLAATTMKFFELGLITAILYFGMSYPLSLVARRLERKLKGGH